MKLTALKLFIIQLIYHMLAIWWVFMEGLAIYDVGLIFLVYFFTGCIGMTVTYHRLLTHKSFKSSKIFEIFGTLCGTVGMTGSSLSWTAAHRHHHVRADKQGDPHSPQVLGYIRAQYLSMFSAIELKRSPVIRSKIHRFIHRYYIPINLTWVTLLFMIWGIWGVMTLCIIPAVVLWNAGSLINTICHTRWLGYRQYNVPDNSVNNHVLGLFMWGEGWHNNHHRFQSRANIGERWWEIDIGYWIILLVRRR